MRRAIRLLRSALVTDDAVDLKSRFYRGICFLVGVVGAFVVVLVNSFQNLPAIVSIGSFGLGAIGFALYWASGRGRYYPKLLLAAIIVTLAVGWFPNAASSGSIGYYFFGALLYPVLFFEGRSRRIAVALVLSSALLLIWLDYQFPDLATPFQRPIDRTLDLLTGFLVSGMVCVLFLWVIMAGYHRERQLLGATVGELAASREQFSKLFEMNPDAVCLVDLSGGCYLDANSGFEQLTGWTKAEIAGRRAEELDVFVEDGDRLRLYQRLKAEHRVQGFVSRFRRRDGQEFWGSTSGGWIDVGGRSCLLFSTRDVSAAIEAEKAVAQSKALLAAILDNTDDVVCLVEPTSLALVLYNEPFAQIIKRVRGKDVRPGLTATDLLPPEGAEQWNGFFARARDEGAFTVDFNVPGTDRTMLCSFNPVRLGGTLIGVSLFAKDVTERKRAEEERDRIAMQLVEAQKMESLGSLAGGVAHDFNNMLGGIMGYADILLGEEANPERREHLRAILQAAARSSELTKKLLAFARRGKNIVEAVDLAASARECAGMLRPSFRPNVKLDLRLGGTWTVDGDPSQINQLLVNLSINANEAMPGGGTLAIDTEDVSLESAAAQPLGVPPGEYVMLRVTDSGVGMTEEVRAHIFEPFFTTKAGGEGTGTGLGLSTVYGIVHLHQGAITVDSTPGEGTAFTVLLPRGRLTRERTAPSAPSDYGSGLILVVEDEPLLRNFTTVALSRLGYKTVAAADGVEGVALFRRHQASLGGVILDLKMPKMDGRAAFLEMRAINPSVPILICSGYGDNEEAQGLITLGAKGLLPKPFRVADLSKQLNLLRS